ncbi:hypothetical protein V2J09_023617 [Rumex salicifolius]
MDNDHPPDRLAMIYKKAISKLADEIFLDPGVNDENELRRGLQVLENVRTKSSNFALDESVPMEFKCHLTKELIQDPVILDTGCTYDRNSIEQYLNDGSKICPESGKMITNTNLIIPNHRVKLLISKWCKNHGVVYPTPLPDSEARIDMLIVKLPTCTFPEKRSAVKELVSLTERPLNHALFNNRKEPIAIALFILLPTENLKRIDPEYLDDLVTLILNLSVLPNIRKAMGESSKVIPFTIESLRKGSTEVKIKASAILANLSELQSNMVHLLKSETSKALLRIIHKKDDSELIDVAATTLVKLCLRDRAFLQRAKLEGMHRIALKKLKNHPEYAKEMLDILTLFLNSCDVVDELMELDAAPSLVSVIKELEGPEEPAVALLYEMCELNENLVELIRNDDEAREALNAIAKSGNEPAIPKAVEILGKLMPRIYPYERYGSTSKEPFDDSR